MLFFHASRSLRLYFVLFFFFSSRRRHTRFKCDWSSDVCSSDLERDGDSESVVAEIGGVCLRVRREWPRDEIRDEHQPTAKKHRNRRVHRRLDLRSEERRVGKEWRARGGQEDNKKRTSRTREKKR